MGTPAPAALQPRALKGRKAIETMIGGGIGIRSAIGIGRIGIGGEKTTRRIDEDPSRGPDRETGIKTARGGTEADLEIGIETIGGAEIEAEIEAEIDGIATAVGVGVEVGAEIAIETRDAYRQKMA